MERRAPLMLDLTDRPRSCRSGTPRCSGSGFRPRKAVGVAAYRSRDTKSHCERFADRARYGVVYCALNTATHPCTHAGVPRERER